ncbi:MAG: sugar transferase [Chloroflexi bacterium]|nr:sugar transferase [Chloroflexota bacterium]
MSLSISAHQSFSYRVVKRAFDVALALVGLALLSPLLLLIAIAVKLTSPGSALYRWRVVGQGGRPFTAYKFRTMVANADAIKAQLMAANEMSGPVFKIKDDPRITPVGRFLRKYSLDELPQLWSVLAGDMSLVGPRPPLQSEWEHFELWQRRKLIVNPGITCIWQVNGRNAIREFNEWVKLDLDYIDRWSLWLDVKLLFLTGLAILKGTGR